MGVDGTGQRDRERLFRGLPDAGVSYSQKLLSHIREEAVNQRECLITRKLADLSGQDARVPDRPLGQLVAGCHHRGGRACGQEEDTAVDAGSGTVEFRHCLRERSRLELLVLLALDADAFPISRDHADVDAVLLVSADSVPQDLLGVWVQPRGQRVAESLELVGVEAVEGQFLQKRAAWRCGGNVDAQRRAQTLESLTSW
ncbi:hypothetical protein [Streptomyces sp. NPDC056227]|uniref:hypothetical protein n=1 Tax=Streptomyces sp. NPDC056227 TaxID=3345753 RepID=UPI0035E25816